MSPETTFDLNIIVDAGLSTFLFGVNTILFVGCIYVLVSKSKRRRVSRYLLLITSIAYTISVFQFAFNAQEIIGVFASLHPNSQEYAVSAGFVDAENRYDLARTIFYGVNTIIADSLLIWRLYVVWDNNIFICIAPIVLEVFFAVCISFSILAVTDMNYLTSSVVPTMASWGIAIGLTAWCLHTAINLGATLSIVWRLRGLRKMMTDAGLGTSRNAPVLITIVESGALSSMTAVVLLVLFALQSEVAVVVLGGVTQLAVIFPTLIVVRVGLGLDHTPAQTDLQTIKETVVYEESNHTRRSSYSPNLSFTYSNHIPLKLEV